MFRKNTPHRQPSLFAIASQLPQTNLKKLKKSKEYAFYRLIFCKINQEDFSVLYSDSCIHPNAPVNSLVASIIPLYHNWTTEEKRLSETKAAVGLNLENILNKPPELEWTQG